MRKIILALIFLLLSAPAMALWEGYQSSQPDDGNLLTALVSHIIQPEISVEKKSPWPFILIITFTVLAIIFGILYMKNKRFHRRTDSIKDKISEYEHNVYDLIHNPEKAREHLKTHKPHPRHAHPGHIRGIPQYHHSLSQLHTYIENALRKGYTYREVRDVLIPKGWTDDDILNAYRMKGFRHTGGRH